MRGIMTEKRKVLDLDEIFGQARTVKIKFQEKQYELVRVEALGPRAISKFQGLQKKANALQMENLKGEISDAQEQQIVALFDQMLEMLCEDLPLNEMGFAMKAKTLEFYVLETQGKNALDVALAKGKKKQTGATSTRS